MSSDEKHSPDHSRAAFDEPQWSDLDFTVLTNPACGVISLDDEALPPCREWLGRRGYLIESLDCRAERRDFVAQLNRIFRWKEQFGYVLGEDRFPPPADALNDAFDFAIPSSGGQVLELIRPDVIAHEHQEWMLDFIDIASQHSRFHLAMGRRFLLTLVIPSDSDLIHRPLRSAAVIPPPLRASDLRRQRP